MNWVIVISNIALASTSSILCLLGWNTLKTIRYLNIGKSFWIPIFLSGLMFVISALLAILNDVFLSLTTASEIGQLMQLMALCSLLVGIFSYSRAIKRNIPEKYVIPEDISTEKCQNEQKSDPPAFLIERENHFNSRTNASSECNHQLGYLSTFPGNASLPEECMSCNKIIECKQP